MIRLRTAKPGPCLSDDREPSPDTFTAQAVTVGLMRREMACYPSSGVVDAGNSGRFPRSTQALRRLAWLILLSADGEIDTIDGLESSPAATLDACRCVLSCLRVGDVPAALDALDVGRRQIPLIPHGITETVLDEILGPLAMASDHSEPTLLLIRSA